MLFGLACIAWGFTRLRHAGLDLSGLVTTSAVITGIIAFSMQETLGNILGGLALQLDNSVRIGDWIKVDDARGKVVNVHWRHTSLLTNNGEIIVIPNSTLMKAKVNVYNSVNRPQIRRWVPFTTGYSAPPAQVIASVEKAIRDAQIDFVSSDPAPQCLVTDYKDGSIYFALLYWQNNPVMDDRTDSTVRLHLYTCLQRQDFMFARPCLDVSLTTESEERNAIRRDAMIEQRLHISFNAPPTGMFFAPSLLLNVTHGLIISSTAMPSCAKAALISSFTCLGLPANDRATKVAFDITASMQRSTGI